MKKKYPLALLRHFFILTVLFSFNHLSAQTQTSSPQQTQSDFWRKVQFGGGLGLSFGSGYTDIRVFPSAIYPVNPIVALGAGLQFGYASQQNYYESIFYGASIIGYINPLPEVQLSVELEETNVNNKYTSFDTNYSENYWNTGLYLGAGYRTGNVTIGIRYDVLFDSNKSIYGDAFMPFIRAYF